MDYEIISLGWNCQPRTYLRSNELIQSKQQGRKSMIFDLTIHHIKGLIEVLKNNFEDYFENVVYEFYEPFGLNYWQNKKYDIVFNHDSEFKENDFDKLKTRYENRIKNFKEIINSNKFLFFVCNLDENSNIEDVENLYNALKNLRGEKPFKLIIWSTFKDFENNLENISILSKHHPFNDFADWFKPECQTKETKLWEKKLCDFVKTEITKSGFKIKTYKTSFKEKFKKFIKPILKNIFTITNDTDLNAKILVILGIKIKLKELNK